MTNQRFIAASLLLVAAGLPAIAQDGGEKPREPAPAPRRTPPPTLDELAARLTKDGLRGTMHGANARLGTYVFTWWDPGSFFNSQNFSLVPATPEVGTALAGLSRHQELLIHGAMVRVPGSQPHVRVDSVEPGKKWDPGVQSVLPPDKPANLARAVKGKKRLRVLVHAIAEDGGMLAVEYRGSVVPVQVPEDAELRRLVKSLYRGDRIDIRFKVAEHPTTPLHLRLVPAESGTEEAPIKVLTAAHELHGKVITVEGHLVLFPRSPSIRRDVWGVEELDKDHLDTYYTIFNFKDMKDQEKTDALLRAAWTSKPEGVKDGRNKYIQTRIKVRVTGEVVNPAANQANPALSATSAQVEILK